MTKIFLHIHPDAENVESDNGLMPNGTIPTLLKIAEDSEEFDVLGIDTSFKEELCFSKVEDVILENKKVGTDTVLMFTILNYNAYKTLKYIEYLKNKFGNSIKIIVGGHLPAAILENKLRNGNIENLEDLAYLKNPNIDCVAVGDGEILLPKILRDLRNGTLQKIYTGRLSKEGAVFSTVSYDNFYLLKERLQAQREEFMGHFGGQKIAIQGSVGPGCSWAKANKKACSFCSLEHLQTKSLMSIKTHLTKVKEIEDQFGVSQFFDFSSIFLPDSKVVINKAWLREFARTKNQLGIKSNFFVYLGTSSVTDEETAELLVAAGVNEVFVGVDHFNREGRFHQHKPGTDPILFLRILNKHNIKFRIGVVLGASAENEERLKSVKEAVLYIAEHFKKNLISINMYLPSFYPGAEIWQILKYKLSENINSKILDLVSKMENEGNLTESESIDVTRSFIEINGGLSAEYLQEFIEQQKIFLESNTNSELFTFRNRRENKKLS
jgi:radical SAM superfamily enzyme YgiQ (UPF0313 family)